MMKLRELVNWYTSLTPETIQLIDGIYHEQASFRDPFNDVRGVRQISAIFEHMFVVTQQPLFLISDWQVQGDIAWVSWTFDFRLGGRSIAIEGATRLEFGDDGRVLVHRDYWDGLDLLVEFPLIGSLLRMIRKRLKAPLHLGPKVNDHE